MTVHDLSSTAEDRRIARVIDAVGAGCFDPHDRGPVVVQIKLWDGRTVEGAYHRCEESELNVVDHEGDLIWDDNALRPFVEKLIAEKTPFVTETGSDDMMCTIRWTIN